MKKVLCILWLFCLCLNLCACGSTQPAVQPEADPALEVPQQVSDSAAIVDDENYLKVAGVQAAGMSKLTENVDLDVYGSARAGGNVWILGTRKEDGRRVLVKLDHLAGDHTTMELLMPESDAMRAASPPEGERLAVLYSLVNTDEALPLLLRTVIHLEDSDEVYRQLYYDFELCTVTAEGVVSEGVSLPVETQGDYLSLGCLNENGIWFITKKWSDNGNYVLTPQLRGYDPATGELLHTVALSDNWYATSLRPLGGSDFAMIGVVYSDETGAMADDDVRMLFVHNAAAEPKVEAPISAPHAVFNLSTFFLPAVDKRPVYLANGWGLWQWDMEENRYTLLHRWKDAGFETRFDWLYVLEDGTFCHIGAVDIGGERMVELWTLGGDTAVPADDRQVITVGVLGSGDDIAAAVKAFTAANGAYTVQLTRYDAEEAAAAGLSSGIELLYRALLQGSAPDVLVTGGGWNLAPLAEKGALTDLYAFLDADAALSRTDFVAGPLAAGEANGRLYSVIPEYTVVTTVGSAEKLGTEPSWNWQEYAALTAGMQAPIYGMGRSTVLAYQASAFVDRTAGRTHMDAPDFAVLLEQSAAWPETMGIYSAENSKERFTSGQSAVALAFVGGFYNVRHDVYTFDGPVVYKGFPGTGSLLTPGMQLSINAACADKQAAWQFVRYFLLPDHQYGLKTALPLRRDALEAQAEAARQPLVDERPDDGIAYGVPNYLDPTTVNQDVIGYWTRALTKEETDRVVDLAETTDTLLSIDTTIQVILEEEASAFYNGVRSAEEAARLIQSRVQTYLDEQK